MPVHRRQFLESMLAAAPASAARERFYWGVGIENCWMAQANPTKDGNRRLLDVFLEMQHYDRWKQDLVADLGVIGRCRTLFTRAAGITACMPFEVMRVWNA